MAQNVVIVIADNKSIEMNSPIKRARRVKRNLSVGISSGDEENETSNIRDRERERAE